jgi:hypothetical protein
MGFLLSQVLEINSYYFGNCDCTSNVKSRMGFLLSKVLEINSFSSSSSSCFFLFLKSGYMLCKDTMRVLPLHFW